MTRGKKIYEQYKRPGQEGHLCLHGQSLSSTYSPCSHHFAFEIRITNYPAGNRNMAEISSPIKSVAWAAKEIQSN